jgi:hypothetical protein
MSQEPPREPGTARRNVVIAFTTPPMVIVTAAIEQIRAAGGRVVLLGPQVRGYEPAAAAADQMVFLRHQAAPVRVDPDNRPKRYSPRWAWLVTRNLSRRAAFGPVRKTIGVPTLWWMALSHSRDALHVVDEADVITALDAGAVYSVWNCARRNQHAAAINGIGPTLEHFSLATGQCVTEELL